MILSQGEILVSVNKWSEKCHLEICFFDEGGEGSHVGRIYKGLLGEGTPCLVPRTPHSFGYTQKLGNNSVSRKFSSILMFSDNKDCQIKYRAPHSIWTAVKYWVNVCVSLYYAIFGSHGLILQAHSLIRLCFHSTNQLKPQLYQQWQDVKGAMGHRRRSPHPSRSRVTLDQ